MKAKFLNYYAYIVEFILSFLVVVGLSLHYEKKTLIDFFDKSANDFAMYFYSIMLAGSIAFFWQFYSRSDTKFAIWLYKKGAFKVYLLAYIFAVIIYSLSLFVLVLNKYISSDILLYVALWCLIMSIMNAYTFIKNIVNQLLLNMKFNELTEDSGKENSLN